MIWQISYIIVEILKVIKNEFLLKVEHTTDQQFYNKFVKKIKWECAS